MAVGCAVNSYRILVAVSVEHPPEAGMSISYRIMFQPWLELGVIAPVDCY